MNIKYIKYLFLICVVAAYLMNSVMTSSADKQSTDQTQKQILTLDKVIELPAATSSAAWGPDGRKLLVDLPYLLTGPFRSAARLIDVETGKLGKPFNALHNGLDHFFWSPDGKYIAVTRIQEIRLLSYPEFKEVGQIKYKWPCYHQIKFGAAFTADSRGLWVACQRRGSKGYGPKTYTAAIKISIPELKVVKRFMAPHPRKGVTSLYSNGRISVLGDKIILCGSLDSGSTSDGLYGARHYKHHFLYSYDLEAGKPFHSAYRLRKYIDEGSASGGVYSPKNNIFAARHYVASWKMVNGLKDLVKTGENVISAKPLEGKPITVYSVQNKLGATGVGHLMFSKSERLLIAMVTKIHPDQVPRKRTTIGVWQAKDLTLLQEIQAVSFRRWMKLSPDGTRLAALARNKMYIYKVSE